MFGARYFSAVGLKRRVLLKVSETCHKVASLRLVA